MNLREKSTPTQTPQDVRRKVPDTGKGVIRTKMSRLLLIVAGAATAGAYVIPSLAATPRTRTRALRCAESSPFEGDDAPSTSSSASATLDFTVENVDKTLDEVRPYLISDGGNVKVVSVDPESFGVQLQLQGACGSCPSCACAMQSQTQPSTS